MRFLLSAVAMSLAFSPAFGAPEARVLARQDGGQIHYTVDAPEVAPAGLIVIAQGSGCGRAADNPSIEAVRAAFGDHVAVTVEKAGVTPEADVGDGFSNCPEAFHAGFTLSGRVADYQRVIEHLRETEGLADLPLVLFGGSEGGHAVARLAADLHPKATIILSSATGVRLDEMILLTLPPEAQEPVSAGFQAARNDPEGSALFAGSSHRFWADILDGRSLDYMMRTESPFLVIQGGLDTSSPSATQRPTLEAFAEAGKCSLTYWEFPGLDHGILTPEGEARLGQVLELAAVSAKAPMVGY
jgi:pimeloyl-ACP methyl ester carboxylesterase